MQGFNPEMGDLAIFVEQYEQDETTDKIAMDKFLPHKRTATPRKTKSVPGRLRNVRTTVRNVAKILCCIVASTEKKILTPQGS